MTMLKQTVKSPMPHEVARAVKSFFGDAPIRDGKTKLYIKPNDEDVAGAVRGDSRHCAFSRACQRIYDSKGALFFGESAYVDLVDEKSRSFVGRYIQTLAMRRFVEAFDKGNRPQLAGFWLLPPRHSRSLKGQRSIGREYKRRKRQEIKAAAAAGRAPKNRPRPEPKSNRLDFFIAQQ
jgi:hypothetical protein